MSSRVETQAASQKRSWVAQTIRNPAVSVFVGNNSRYNEDESYQTRQNYFQFFPPNLKA